MILYVTNNDSSRVFLKKFLSLIWIVTSEAEQQKRDLKIAKDKLALTRFGNLLLLKINEPEIRSENNFLCGAVWEGFEPKTTVVLRIRTVTVV